LQEILLREVPDLAFADQQVGKVARKADDFAHYCFLAFEKLGLDIKVRKNK
jgi:hypothetical protein